MYTRVFKWRKRDDYEAAAFHGGFRATAAASVKREKFVIKLLRCNDIKALLLLCEIKLVSARVGWNSNAFINVGFR